MAANYWESTQRRYWQFTKEELAQRRQQLEESDQNLVQMFPLPEWRHLNIYFHQQIIRLGKRLAVRQQPVATAQVYIKRFYSKVEIRRTNPYLVIATALYLACKTEECPQHIRLIVSEARALWPADFISIDTPRIGECEFFLISEMNAQLIIHQPYRTLTSLQSDFNLSQEENNLAWSTINDHYMTDLPLIYPPHIIALTAILLTLVLRPNSGLGNAAAGVGAAASALAQVQQAQAQARAGSGPGAAANAGRAPGAGAPADGKDKQGEGQRTKIHRFVQFLAESDVDIEGMIDCTQELISYYECHEQYDDKLTREQINRFVKARGLDLKS